MKESRYQVYGTQFLCVGYVLKWAAMQKIVDVTRLLGI